MTITPEARELTHKMNAMIDFDKALEAAQLAINSAVAEKDKEIERLKHLIDCSKTPFMREVIAERESLKRKLAKLEEIADGLAAGFTIYPNLIWTEKCADALEALKQYKESK